MPARIASAVLRRIPARFSLPNLCKHLRQAEPGVDEQFLEPLVADGSRLALSFHFREFFHVLISSQDQTFPACPALQCLFLKLKGIADTPGQERTDENDDVPRMDSHRARDDGTARRITFVLRECRTAAKHPESGPAGGTQPKLVVSTHERFSLAPHSEQNLLAGGFLAPHEPHKVCGVDFADALREPCSRRISTSRSSVFSILSICSRTTATSAVISLRT